LSLLLLGLILLSACGGASSQATSTQPTLTATTKVPKPMLKWKQPTNFGLPDLLVDKEMLYYSEPTQYVALHLTDAHDVAWKLSLTRVEARGAIEGDALYLPISLGTILVLDKKTGIQRAKFVPITKSSISSIVIVGGIIYGSAGAGQVFAIKSSDG